MHNWYVIVSIDPYAFLAKLMKTDKKTHGTIIRNYPNHTGGEIYLTTAMSKVDLMLTEGVVKAHA